MAHTFLKLTRSLGAWTEMRDTRTGSTTQVRAVRCADDPSKVQLEFRAPPEVQITRVSGSRTGASRA